MENLIQRLRVVGHGAGGWWCRCVVSRCEYVGTFEGAFMSMPGETNTSVTLHKNRVHGFVWCTNKVTALGFRHLGFLWFRYTALFGAPTRCLNLVNPLNLQHGVGWCLEALWPALAGAWRRCGLPKGAPHAHTRRICISHVPPHADWR